MNSHIVFAAAAAIVAASPALALSAQPSTYSQPSYGQSYSPPDYVQPAHSEPGYGSQNPIRQAIDELLGNRYADSDRQAVSVCASAALNQAAAKFRINGYSGYSGGYSGYDSKARTIVSRYPVNPRMRVSSITNVDANNGGLRVKGLIDSGMTQSAIRGPAYQGVGSGGQAYANRYPSANDLSFRCNVDHGGRITSLRVERNTTTYRRF